MAKVFIPNQSIHDFSAAEKYGELVFLSSGNVRRYNVSMIYRSFIQTLSKSTKDDYLLVSGLTMLNLVACYILTKRHGRLNMLLFKPGSGGQKEYLERILQ